MLRAGAMMVFLLPALAGCASGAAAVDAAAKGIADALPACPANASAMDGWDDRAPPRRIFGNTYYVGTCGITALLLASPDGHILIDGATPAAAPHITANIRALGFRPDEVRYLLNSHEHADHAGGLAQLQRDTGATLLARAPAIATLKRGSSDRTDPQFLLDDRYPPVADVQAVADGDVVRVGDLAVTAHATPGHTPGGTSWTWRSCEGAQCLEFAYTDSTTAISDKVYRYSDQPAYLAAFREGLARMATLPCDVQISPHPLASNLFARMDGTLPLAEGGACRRHADAGLANLERRLRNEQDGTAP